MFRKKRLWYSHERFNFLHQRRNKLYDHKGINVKEYDVLVDYQKWRGKMSQSVLQWCVVALAYSIWELKFWRLKFDAKKWWEVYSQSSIHIRCAKDAFSENNSMWFFLRSQAQEAIRHSSLYMLMSVGQSSQSHWKKQSCSSSHKIFFQKKLG